VVHEHATVAAGCRVSTGCVIGPWVRLGARCTLSYNVALTHCTVGTDCVFHHGVSVGQDGACDLRMPMNSYNPTLTHAAMCSGVAP